MVFINCDKEDLQTTMAMMDLLVEEGFAVEAPTLDERPDIVRKQRNAAFQHCDGLVIISGTMRVVTKKKIPITRHWGFGIVIVGGFFGRTPTGIPNTQLVFYKIH